MNESVQERLYNLLPVLYRQRDLAHGEALRALMSVLESERQKLEVDIAAGYNNWFIETCDEWVIPYIADLVGIRDLSQTKHIFSTQRRQVANTIGYRRRKGTIAVLEHVLRDATGWPSYAVEFFEHMAITQYPPVVRRDRGRTVDLRRAIDLAELDGPFDELGHTVDVHSVYPEPPEDLPPERRPQGKYGPRNLGLFFWRLRSYCMTNSAPCPIQEDRNGRHGLYTFHPLGVDMQLFHRPQPVAEITQRAASLHLPIVVSRRRFAADLEAYEAQYGDRPEEDRPSNSRYYGPERGLNVCYVLAQPPSQAEADSPPLPVLRPVPPLAVLGMDLSRWNERIASRVRERYPNKQVAIDARLGRVALLQPPQPYEKLAPENIRVAYSYGFSTGVGGGPYYRTLPRVEPSETSFEVDVAKGMLEEDGKGCVSTLSGALRRWGKHCTDCIDRGEENPRGVIRILDNGRYDEKLEIKLPRGAQLSIVADNGVRPVIGNNANLTVICPDGAGDDKSARAKRQLHLNGLLIHGGLRIGSEGWNSATGGLNATLNHCTLVTAQQRTLEPAPVEVALAEEDARELEVNIDRSIVGPLYLPATTKNVNVRDSIVDGGSGFAIAACDGSQPNRGPAVSLERTTVFGKTFAQRVTASDVIFTGQLQTDPSPGTRDRIGCSYVPEGSTTNEGMKHPSVSGETAPRFTSTRYGHPAYAQLGLDCPRAIRGGAADGSEMGAFHDLHQRQAEANVRGVLEEYLPLGLRAGIYYVT